MPTDPDGVDASTNQYPGRKVYGMGQTLSREQIAQIAYQAGFRGQDLINFVGIAWRESAGGNYQVRGTDSPVTNKTGDFGLFGINSVNDTAAARAAVGYTDRDQWLDPLVNAKMAFYLFQTTGMSPWGGGKDGFTAGGDPFYGVNLTAAASAVDNAQSQGLIGKDYATGGQTAAMPGTSNSAAAGGPMTLPPDAVLYNNGFTVVAVFDVGGVKIGYNVNWFDGSVKFDPNAVQFVSAEQWQSMGVVDAGNAEELRNLSTGTFKQFFDNTIAQVMGANNPAAKDPDVLKVLAEFAGRPDMTPAELQNKLQATPWYQAHTQGELEWNSLPEAERQKQRDDKAAAMASTWFQFTGEAISADDPRITNYLEQVSSGKMGIGAWTENVVKKAATDNAESPWSRQVRDEGEQQLQRGVDIENTTQRVRDLASKWGVQYAESTFQDWGRQITENKASEADILEMIKDQAQILYPWKARDMDTTTAATPWTQTYERVMEKSADLTNPQVQAALTAGQPAWEFEKSLKNSSGWLETKNARDDLYGTISETGKRLGFE